MAKSAGMSLYNNNKFEQSYITFKAEAETLRMMCDQAIKNSTGVRDVYNTPYAHFCNCHARSCLGMFVSQGSK